MPKIYNAADEEFQSYTGQTSTVARSLAIAGIGVVWLYAGSGADGASFVELVKHIQENALMSIALVACFGSLTLDLLQYAVSSFRSGRYSRVLEVVLNEDDYAAASFTGRVRWAWYSSYGLDLAQYIVEAADGSPSASSGVSAAEHNRTLVQRARILLGGVDRHNATPQTDGELRRVAEALEESWSPQMVSRPASVLFWLKTVLVTIGYLAMAIAVLSAILPDAAP